MISSGEVALLLNAGAEREEHIDALSQMLSDGLLRFDDAMNVLITPQGMSHLLVLPAIKE
jgi:hypothetical protein